MNFIKTDEQYGEGFEVSEYKGKIGLIAAREAKDGKVYQKWGDIETGKDSKKRLPVQVVLGTSERAIAALEEAIAIIKQGADAPF